MHFTRLFFKIFHRSQFFSKRHDSNGGIFFSLQTFPWQPLWDKKKKDGSTYGTLCISHFVFFDIMNISQSKKKNNNEKLKFNIFHLKSEGTLPFCFSKQKNLHRTQTF